METGNYCDNGQQLDKEVSLCSPGLKKTKKQKNKQKKSCLVVVSPLSNKSLRHIMIYSFICFPANVMISFFLYGCINFLCTYVSHFI